MFHIVPAAGRVTHNVSGDILINNQPLTRKMKRKIAYVLQNDTFFGNLTVRETLTYTAYIKLSSRLTFPEKRQRVTDVMQELLLTKCADTPIGSALVVRKKNTPSPPKFSVEYVWKYINYWEM